MPSGQCLCGESKVAVQGDFNEQIACHCTDCQHTSGSAHSTNILAPISETEITGMVKEYNSKASSGNTVTRVFCGNCGSALAHKSKAFGDKMAVQTGNLAGLNKIPINTELFVKDRWTGLPAIPDAAQVQVMP